MDGGFLVLMGCSGVPRKSFCRWIGGCSAVSHTLLIDETRGVIRLLTDTFFTRSDRRQPGWGNPPPLRLRSAVRVGLSVELLIKMNQKYALRIQ